MKKINIKWKSIQMEKYENDILKMDKKYSEHNKVDWNWNKLRK